MHEYDNDVSKLLIERLIFICTFSYYYEANVHDHDDPLEIWRGLLIIYELLIHLKVGGVLVIMHIVVCMPDLYSLSSYT